MDIRDKFLKFFKSKGHNIVPSSPLVPNDSTLLFTNAGMVQFKNIFTGDYPIPEPPRATSSQTCIRVGGKHNDLDNVGYTARHHTFFEMLGNFSFGDYFKREAIAFAWEFVTSKEYLALPIDKIWVTVHKSDDEAFNLWKKHIEPNRIKRFGDKDNFWQMGNTGPCGPCSEIFYDQGEENFSSVEDYLGGDGDRFLEIWNLVFMQYERDSLGKLTPLPKPSIDTGMGLERVVAIKEGVLNNFDSSLFMPYINKLSEIVGREPTDKTVSSYRVIADHLRSTSFLLAQGVTFDKDGRGYVLRRVARRAVRHGYLLGIREPFLYKMVDSLVEVMGGAYKYLPKKAEMVKSAIKIEEERFFETIDAGIKIFNEELRSSKAVFSGEVAFKLYDTYGFPVDLTQDMLRDRGMTLDIESFNEKMERQKAKSRASWRGSGDINISGDFKLLEERFGRNKFVGYQKDRAETKILALLNEEYRNLESLSGRGWVMLEETPFYAESGGQVGDRGEIIIDDGESNIKVLDTKKFNSLNLSLVDTKGTILRVGDRVEAVVDKGRVEIARHHSATHLLHSALENILGEHITQAGSLVEESRLRFDFTHPKPLSREEIKEVESWVNRKIEMAIESKSEEMALDIAKKRGAKALFNQKYGERVRVVSFDDLSVELCGGIHVKNSSEIALFIITKESGVSAGVRRVEAVCSRSAKEFINRLREEREKIVRELKSPEPLLGIKRLKSQIKGLKEELESVVSSSKKELKIESIGEINVIVDRVESGDIKKIVDEVKNRYESVAVMLFMKRGDRVLIASGSKNTPIKAGEWIKEVAPIVGGGGGGRADFAQAGGRDSSKIDEALKVAKEYIIKKSK